MAKKGLTLDEKRAMIKALFNSRNEPVEVAEVKVDKVEQAPVEEQIDEGEEAERLHVKRKRRHKDRNPGRMNRRGRR